MQLGHRSALLGVPIGMQDLDALLERSMQALHERCPQFTFACANPHSLVTAHSDQEFRAALLECTAVVADGVGLTIAARLTGTDIGPRITGTDFFLGLMTRVNQRGGRVMFFGSRDTVLERMAIRARHDFPNIHVDVLAPPFGEWSDAENADMVERIEHSRPDVLWVGMTAPRQEKWVHRNASSLSVPVIGSIGAVFDYYAGTVRRAPPWVCRAGLEWLYRFTREPRRLWRRTMLSAPTFVWLVVRERALAPWRQ